MKTLHTILGAGCAVLLLAAGVEAAGTQPAVPPGKMGLYETRMFSNMAMFIARDMKQVPPAEQERLSRESLSKPGPFMRFCADKEIAKSVGTGMGKTPDCSFENVQSSANGFAADVRCPLNDKKMHFTLEVVSPDRRLVSTSIMGMPGAAVPVIQKFDIAWVSADCGALKPGQVEMNGRILTPR